MNFRKILMLLLATSCCHAAEKPTPSTVASDMPSSSVKVDQKQLFAAMLLPLSKRMDELTENMQKAIKRLDELDPKVTRVSAALTSVNQRLLALEQYTGFERERQIGGHGVDLRAELRKSQDQVREAQAMERSWRRHHPGHAPVDPPRDPSVPAWYEVPVS
jgi:hypothetical protein